MNRSLNYLATHIQHVRGFWSAKIAAILAVSMSLFAIAVPGQAATAAPSWKIEVIVYMYTDITYPQAGVSHRLVASLMPDQITNIRNTSSGFVTTDIPVLTSGHEHPRVTVKTVNRVLNSSTLVPDGYGGWAPDPWSTKTDQDAGYDSYVVLWQSSGWDFGTNKVDNIGHVGGLTWDMKTGPTFSEINMPELEYGGHNVFKHEWGHAITFYYDARGTAPKPAVDNHQPGTSVNCRTHKGYDLRDETAANPIPNSVYNDQSGFTHDYYSGVTAQASNSNRCLGITPTAWQSGGPLTKS